METAFPCVTPPDMRTPISTASAPSPPTMIPHPDAALLNNIALASRMMSLQNALPKVKLLGNSLLF